MNEIGVVYLFTKFAPKWRLEIDEIRGAFPDCLAYRKTGDGRRPLRIEFEYKASRFKRHRHNPKGCDWVVCWVNDWPGAPANLVIKELRSEFGLGFNIWLCAVAGEAKQQKSAVDRLSGWSVPGRARVGDLLLFYKIAPEKQIEDAFRVVSEPARNRASLRKGTDFTSEIRRVTRIRSALRLEDLRRRRGLATAGFVRASIRGKYMVTEHWPELLQAIAARDPRAGRVLRQYASPRLSP